MATKTRRPSVPAPAAPARAKRAAKAPAAKKTAAPRKRAPGRPNTDSPDQRARLLDAALACYVSRGIHATSLRDVAVEAGVTPALVHYYYGDKPQLTEAVVQQRLLPAFAFVHQRVAAVPDDDVAETIAMLVNGLSEVIRAHPWWPQLWVREVLCEGGALRDLLALRVAPSLAKTVVARFAAAQKAGKLNADLDPRLLMTSLIGLTLLPAAGAPIWKRLFDADDLGIEDIRGHALALLDRGLELKS